MTEPQWYSKKERLSRASRNLRALGKRHKKTNGFLLLSNAIGKAKDGEHDEALREIERFELVTVELSASDRALLQSAKGDLAKSSESWLLKLMTSTLLGVILKHLFATFWKWIVSKDLIYFKEYGLLIKLADA